MKKLFFSLLLLLTTATFCSAQGNLQFNQIIFLDVASGGIQAMNVPAGKVWKIESTGTGSSSSSGFFLRNSSSVNIGYLSTANTTAASAYPVWLPSGFIGSVQNISAYRGFISIIEFNVI